MVPFTILRTAFYGAALFLSSLPGTWSLPLNSSDETVQLSKRANYRIQCHGVYQSTVEAALDEAKAIMSYAEPQLQIMLGILQRTPVPSIIGMTNAERTLFQTYEAFYGQSYFNSKTQADALANENAIARLNTVIATANHISLALDYPSAFDYTIYCDDNFFWQFDDDGQFPVKDYGYWDSRFFADGRGAWAKVTKCGDAPQMSAYCYHPARDLGLESVIVLCNDHMNSWADKHTRRQTLGAGHDNGAFPANFMTMDYIWSYLPSTLIHELSHARVLMPVNPKDNTFLTLGDMCLQDGSEAYQFQCIHRLAVEDPERAVKNADTFSLFVTAIYLNGNDWSTGVGQPLGYTPLVQN